VLPTVGAALIGIAIGSAMWRAVPPPRRRAAIVCLAVLPILVLPIHWARHQSTKNQGILSTQLLEQVRLINPGIDRLVVVDDPQARPTIASAFGAELPRAVELVTGRRLHVELLSAPASGSALESAHTTGTLVLRLRNGVVEADRQ
jgi:hypothetical protein